jgi:methionyl-tRNA formyltransferase
VKIVYIGSSTILSYIPLRTLIASGRSVDAIAVWGQNFRTPDNPKFPLLIENSTSLVSLSLEYGIPLIELTGDWLSAQKQLVSIAPDLILVACFGQKLPDDIVSTARYGCFNLHPSLLPGFRGPAPVFWQFRQGVNSYGVSLHRVSPQLDGGEIVDQVVLNFPDGINRQRVDTLLAGAGSRLFEAVLRSIEHGSLRSRAQSHIEASYQSYPSAVDYTVSTRWTARRIYNFICATRAPGIVFPCEVDGRTYRLTEAKSYRDEGGVSSSIKGNSISINCSRGVVEALWLAGTEQA